MHDHGVGRARYDLGRLEKHVLRIVDALRHERDSCFRRNLDGSICHMAQSSQGLIAPVALLGKLAAQRAPFACVGCGQPVDVDVGQGLVLELQSLEVGQMDLEEGVDL